LKERNFQKVKLKRKKNQKKRFLKRKNNKKSLNLMQMEIHFQRRKSYFLKSQTTI